MISLKVEADCLKTLLFFCSAITFKLVQVTDKPLLIIEDVRFHSFFIQKKNKVLFGMVDIQLVSS